MILPHEEEQQFIPRLRFVVQSIPDNANRNSFMFIAENQGMRNEFAMVRKDFNLERNTLKKLPVLPTINTLEDTQARVHTERTESIACHLDLWEEYGLKTLTSRFEVMADEDEPSKEVSKRYHEAFKAYVKRKTRAMCDMMLTEDMNDVPSISSQLEFGSGMELILTSTKDDQTATLEKAFASPDIAIYILKQKFQRQQDLDRILGKPTMMRLYRTPAFNDVRAFEIGDRQRIKCDAGFLLDDNLILCAILVACGTMISNSTGGGAFGTVSHECLDANVRVAWVGPRYRITRALKNGSIVTSEAMSVVELHLATACNDRILFLQVVNKGGCILSNIQI